MKFQANTNIFTKNRVLKNVFYIYNKNLQQIFEFYVNKKKTIRAL